MRRRATLAVLPILVCAVAGCGWCPWLGGGRKTVRAYIVHHGEGAFEEIAREFRAETGMRVKIRFACRSGIYDVVKANGNGDVVVSSKRSVLDQLKKDGCTEGERMRIGALVPIIEVAKGNPKNIQTLADLGRADVRVALAREPGCVGKLTKQILEKNGLTAKVQPNVVKRVLGHAKTAGSVDGEEVDATIIWLWAMRDLGSDKVEAVPILPGQNVIEDVEAMVLNTGRNRDGGEQFAAFLQCPKAQEILARAGLVSKR